MPQLRAVIVPLTAVSHLFPDITRETSTGGRVAMEVRPMTYLVVKSNDEASHLYAPSRVPCVF